MSGPLGFVLPAISLGLGALVIRPKRGFSVPAGAGNAGPPEMIVAQATIEERHHDTLAITEHPVEMGAAIADHAFKEPAEVIIRCGWSNSPSGPGSLVGQAVGIGAALGGPPVGILASIPSTLRGAQSVLSGNSQDQLKAIYQRLLKLQADRVPFDVFTGKRAYKQMLFKVLAVETDETKENILALTAHCRQVLIATTQTVTVPNNGAAMKLPEQTLPVEPQGNVQLGPATTITPDAGTLTGSINALSADVAAAQATVDSMTGFQGPLGQLQNVMGNLQDKALTAMGELPAPFEIPLKDAVPQSFGINLGLPDLTGVQVQVLDDLKAASQSAQQVINDAVRQIPSTPDVPGALASQLGSVEERIRGTLQQLDRVNP